MNQPPREQRKDIPAPAYLRWLFQPSERIAILIRSCKRGEITQRIASAATLADPPFQRWLYFKNHHQASDIYVGMNPLKTESRARTKEDILAIRHVYVDLDRDAIRSLAEIEDSNLVPQPNAVLHTSPHKMQVVWKVDGFDQVRAESLLRAIARKFAGDPAATDCTRMLRLPGFRNHKYDQPFPVHAELRTGRIYNSDDFQLQAEISDQQARPARSFTHRPDSQRTTLSQSEHDWAFAKRCLAKGVPSEEVLQQIAAFRAHDKRNPQDYANRTVRKALLDIEHLKPRRNAGSLDGTEDQVQKR